MGMKDGMFRPWTCRVCRKPMAAYLLDKQNAKKRTGVCGDCVGKPPEDRRITALKDGQKVKL